MFKFCFQSTAEVEIPATHAGKLLDILLTAFNSGNEDNWREFIENNWKRSDDPNANERRLEFFRNSYELSNAFRV